MHGGRLTYLTLPLPEPLRSDDLYSVTGFAKGKGGRIWIATYNAVFGFDGASFTTIDGGAWRYDGRGLRQFTASDGLTSASVMAIDRDRDGVLWLGGTGVFRFDGSRFERVR